MKLKVTPEDFRVEEVTDLALSPAPGPFAVYRLTKSSWDTFDLIDLLARRMGVPKRAISVGGIKDRHGRTTQLISIEGLSRRPRTVEDKNFAAELAGYSREPLCARAVRGNRFSLVLRDMSEAEVRFAVRNLSIVREIGVPNYYDEQRFGSARHGKGFMGKSIFLGRREEALRLYFLPSKHDDQKTRKLKTRVTESWGRWGECTAGAFGEYARILAYLQANPRAFHKALALIDRRFLVFVINAYQSFLFNEILRLYLDSLSRAHRFAVRDLRYAFGSYLFPESLPAPVFRGLAAAELPVPGYDSRAPDPEVGRILAEVLQSEGIRREDLRVRQMSGVSAHGVLRAALAVPEDLEGPDVAEDERYPKKKKMGLSFYLPRGSYATILVKRLVLSPAAP